MTRALIADPDLPGKARAAEIRSILRCIGCNACIAHYHAGTPIALRRQSTHRARAGDAAIRAGGPPRARGSSSPAAGPAGLAAAAEQPASGHEVVVLERTDRIGGQLRARRDAHRADAEMARRFVDLLDRRVDATQDPGRAVRGSPPEIVSPARPRSRRRATGGGAVRAAISTGRGGRGAGVGGPAGGRAAPAAASSSRTGAAIPPVSTPPSCCRRRQHGDAGGRLGLGRRSRPPVPAQPLSAAAVSRRCRGSPASGAGRGRRTELCCCATSSLASCTSAPGRPPRARAGPGAGDRPRRVAAPCSGFAWRRWETASRRARSRRRCSRGRSPCAG